MLKILFMGTPDFARDSLKAIYETKNNIVGVVTVPDKPKGRGMKMIASPVKEYALLNNIKIWQPEKLKGNIEFIKEIQNINPDVICVVAYGKILPEEILKIPKLGCINVHPSLLPKYRGPAPIQYAIINGDKKTGVTTMYLNSEMDAGDIILQEEVLIENDETSGELWERSSKIGAKLLVKTLEKIEKNDIPRIKQGKNFTTTHMLEKEIAKINWKEKTGIEIKNLVRGLNPIMGAYSTYDNKKMKFWKIENLEVQEFINKYPEFKEYEYKFKNIEPGTIIYIDPKEGIFVKTVDSIIVLLEVQAENSKKMPIQDFLRGNKIEVGVMFK